MDPALLRERELFKKRALSTPAVERRPAPSESSSSKKRKARPDKEASGSKQGADSNNGSFNLKALSGSSGYRFGVLAKIVNYMKTRHQKGDTHGLSLEEILDETKLLDIGMKQKQWLMGEALANNPKIEVNDGRYGFKPKYNLKDKKALLRLLDKHDQLGLGGVMLEDVEEGLPNSAKAIKALGDQIVFVTRPDKRKILFFNDKHCQFTVDDEFQKLWRSIPVDSMDEEKIEEYLKRQGITSMQETGPKKMLPIHKRKKGGSQKARRFKTHNHHLAGVLEDYTDGVPTKK
ncbi:transcription initiation factor IIE subunit beta isoform X1 [Clupea harengus]|uniref:Transcription initiation factor IIE subunit beta n=1 Tax=Clupea harengus TaxID=7950 RepID=A0A6P8EWV8_CLUHA|nr:transcription initiation factor IIE subunit beta isoform X1 [Clupea harengus]XP_031416340.1 transcription initiation factor IIE subunit beta isoform X1 [Clupea harengus]XP_031416341.1 transcription initiation factor IIE subunit beta isoform X1 [Clupea harengus]